MGMAATQARFLSLTARKSNVEFQGQQINQQRTTLSNESANYYSELCNMVVPTPPSIDSYTKISYTFNDGAMTNTVTSMLANPNRNEDDVPYLISYVQQWEDDYSPVQAASSFINETAAGYFIGNTQLRLLGNAGMVPVVGNKFNGYDVQKDDDGNYFVNEKRIQTSYAQCTDEDIANFKYYLYDTENKKVQEELIRENDKFYNKQGEEITDLTNLVIGIFDEKATNPEYATQLVVAQEDENGNTVYTKQVYDTVTEKHILTTAEVASITTQNEIDEAELSREEAYRYLLNEKYNNNDKDGQWYVRYVKDSQTGTDKPYFYKAKDVESTNFAGDYGTVSCYTIGSTTRTKEVVNAPAAIPERDSSGRYISITLYDRDKEGNVDKTSAITYTLTTNTVTDEAAYNNALNEYNYQQAQYDKKVQDINSKLEIVQQQDKSLELNLKQLDTEEQAINTEMEAVQKVISKNVQDTFGTFKTTA